MIGKCGIAAAAVCLMAATGAAAQSGDAEVRAMPDMRMPPQSIHDQPADHVPPPAPAQPMPAMSDAEMARVMEMDDRAAVWMLKVDEFERGKGDDAYAGAWNAEAWYGGDFDKLWLRSEGERETGTTAARLEALWDHAFASWWDGQVGLRHDENHPFQHAAAGRDWAAFGVSGMAPYWFQVEATVYVAGAKRTAARLRVDYDLLLTQRLILQPELELNLYGKRDRALGVAAGLSDAEFGLRLRYELRREFAPYVGLVRKYRSADLTGVAAGRSETQVIAGIRWWL